MVAWRAVIARGDFIQALCDETGGTPRITLQPVAVEQLATPTITPSEAPTWQGAATPHIWSFTSEGRGRLVLACDRRVGPDVPFEAWLEDQIADLEWGWDHPEAKGFLRSPWPKTRTLG
jgi:hypothetical protein